MRINSNIAKRAPEDVVQKRFLDISRAVNGGLSFGTPDGGLDNVNGFWLNTITPGVADTEFTVTHNLQRIPTGILVWSVDKAAIIYASRRASWSETQAFFKANLPSVSLVGFIS